MKLKEEKVTFLKNQTFNNIKANFETETDLKRKKPEKIELKWSWKKKEQFFQKTLTINQNSKSIKANCETETDRKRKKPEKIEVKWNRKKEEQLFQKTEHLRWKKKNGTKRNEE